MPDYYLSNSYTSINQTIKLLELISQTTSKAYLQSQLATMATTTKPLGSSRQNCR